MRQCKHGLYVALLVILCAIRPLGLRAQEEKPLDMTVTLKADHERLEDVLNELAKQGYITFSYQSDALKKDRLVTLTIRENTLREALEMILGKTYDYVESDDYVVIRRRVPMASKRMMVKEKKMMVKEKAFRMGKVGPKYKDVQAKRWNDRVQPRMKMMKKRLAYPADTVNFAALRQTVRDIIDNMVADKIVKDKDSFVFFGLDNGQFVVDGRPMADSLRAKYAEKYIKADGNGYYYEPVSIKGHGYFFDKSDIYGSPH